MMMLYSVQSCLTCNKPVFGSSDPSDFLSFFVSFFHSNGFVEDRYGYKIKLYDDALEILKLLSPKEYAWQQPPGKETLFYFIYFILFFVL